MAKNLLRGKGWIVPNYGAPPAKDKQEILRGVVRETMTADLVERLVTDLIAITECLMTSCTPTAYPTIGLRARYPHLRSTARNTARARTLGRRICDAERDTSGEARSDLARVDRSGVTTTLQHCYGPQATPQ
ncbi:hypothetical protein AURDEDRAFT_173258 [Auricularia subglabra TFB-10046 SS5]|uniref:Uncharacterized protein n=1 Tax=Auricularia subglabra (strain TFB-10046 / SS5) TaxID=717982 RepID=J0LHW5_AURST|nr:hypothetical protein AURDEDRAFT_173258 [Auricularia subglabra TFB-10046 SS5]